MGSCRESNSNVVGAENNEQVPFVRVSCHVSSSPRAKIQWLYDGIELDDRKPSLNNLFHYEIHESATKGANSVSRLIIKVNFCHIFNS